VGQGERQHEQRRIVQQAALAHFRFGVQPPLGEHTVGGRQQIVEQHKRAPVGAQPDVAAGRDHGAGHHYGHGRLDGPVGRDAQQVVFGRHGHRYGQAPEHGEHGQAQLLGAGQAQLHVAQMNERHRKHVGERAPADVREPGPAQPLGRVQGDDRGQHLASGQEPIRREPVTGQHGLVDDRDQRGRGRVQQRRADFGKPRRPRCPITRVLLRRAGDDVRTYSR